MKMKWLLVVLPSAGIAIALGILLGVQVEASKQRSESYTEKEAYNVEVLTPLKYTVISSRGYRTGVFDVVDNQEIVIQNADTASGAFQVQCKFSNQIGGVYRNTRAVTLTANETKSIVCSADTQNVDRITYSFDVAPPTKSITEIRYREVPRTRVVNDKCSMSLMKKLLDASC